MITPASPFVDALKAFDSHERGILLQWSTGADFRLSADLRGQLGETLEPLTVPATAFVAMDYTLDWMYAAVRRYLEPQTAGPGKPHIWPQAGQLAASIEDVDLLIAWQDDQPRLLLLEAKGFTGWDNSQLLRKVTRLGSIFGELEREAIDVHFILVGPRHSAGVKTDAWPAWLLKEDRYHFIKIDDPGDRFAVQRCTEAGIPTKAQPPEFWQVVKRRWT